MKNKKCKFCGEDNHDMFYEKYLTTCKRCYLDNNRDKNKRWYRANRERAITKEKERQDKNITRFRWLAARARANKKGIEFTITPEDIDLMLWRQDNKCFYTGVEFKNDRSGVLSMSIDRIDSSKGYTPDNVRLVCSLVNKMKSDRTEEGFLNCVRDIYHHMRLYITHNI